MRLFRSAWARFCCFFWPASLTRGALVLLRDRRQPLSCTRRLISSLFWPLSTVICRRDLVGADLILLRPAATLGVNFVFFLEVESFPSISPLFSSSGSVGRCFERSLGWMRSSRGRKLLRRPPFGRTFCYILLLFLIEETTVQLLVPISRNL